MPPTCRRRGFTLIELLVVMAIIAVIAGMILAAYRPLVESQKRSRTVQILSMAANALRAGGLEQGGLPDPAEHPFAGSKQPRMAFRGRRGGSWGDLATAGEALLGVDESRVEAAAADRLLLPDDLCNEPGLPAFFGVQRGMMGILGAPQANLSRALNLSKYSGTGTIPSSDLAGAAKGYLPYDATVNAIEGPGDGGVPGTSALVTADAAYPAFTAGNPRFPRDRFLQAGTVLSNRRLFTRGGWPRNEYWQVLGTPYDNLPLFNRLLQSGVMDELRSLGGLREPVLPDHGLTMAAWDAAAYADHLYRAGGIIAGPSVPPGWDSRIAHTKLKSTDSMAYGEVAARADSFRVWSDDAGKPAWEPGRINDGGTWKTYRIRGLALYDAWGTEILYQRTGAGTFVLISAGRDRCFAIRPRDDGTFATDISSGYAGTPTAPDRDATIDNIRTDKLQ